MKPKYKAVFHIDKFDREQLEIAIKNIDNLIKDKGADVRGWSKTPILSLRAFFSCHSEPKAKNLIFSHFYSCWQIYLTTISASGKILYRQEE